VVLADAALRDDAFDAADEASAQKPQLPILAARKVLRLK